MCASCTAAEPIPLPTAFTSTVSPGCSPPRAKSMCQAVAKGIWSAAASTSPSSSGTRRSCEAEQTRRSAYPPEWTKLMKPAERQSDSRPLLGDPPDDLEPQHVRRLDREARDPFADVDVEVVEGAGRHVERNLAGPRPWIVELLEPQDFGASELVENHRLHEIFPLPSAKRRVHVYV